MPGTAGIEICNGTDDDCDGEVDNNIPPLVCGNGQCAETVEACTNGVPNICEPNTNVGTEVCDGIDNDCDGQNNEGLGYRVCGKGVCAQPVYSCGGISKTFEPGQFRWRAWYEQNNFSLNLIPILAHRLFSMRMVKLLVTIKAAAKFIRSNSIELTLIEIMMALKNVVG